MKQCCMRLDESAPVDEAMVIAAVVIALASIVSGTAVVCAGYAVHAVAYGARNAYEQRLCLRMG